MRKVIVCAQYVSMDGVMQAPRGPTEDPGFKVGGWATPYVDQEFGEELDRVFKEKLDLLLGRNAYEIFAGVLVLRGQVDHGLVDSGGEISRGR